MFLLSRLKVDWKAIGSVVGWLVGYFVFLVLGAFAFWKIEAPYDLTSKRKARGTFLEKLKLYNISVNSTMIHDIVKAAIDADNVGGLDLEDFTKDVETAWSLGGSLFFASTIVTTIGYGNIAPKSHEGRSFTIIYALFGIPFTGVVLAKIGSLLSNLIKRADSFIETRITQWFPKISQREDTKKYVRLSQLMFVMIAFVLFFWIIPAICMTYTENWLFSDAAYFCFISLTTIGLGDIVPGASSKGISLASEDRLDTFRQSTYQVSVLLYLILGLSALTIILNLVGSLLKLVAERTLQHGKNTMMNAGNKISGAGGKIAVTGGRFFDEIGQEGYKFASSMKRKFSKLQSTSDPPTPSSSRNSPLKSNVGEKQLDARLEVVSENQENNLGIEGLEDASTDESWPEAQLDNPKDSTSSLNENCVRVSLERVSHCSKSSINLPKPIA